ncbi:hypothetical protein PRZ48_007855 [Zasmidium cellare]|uniref:3-beta hydroxysteroid dehydrogenase/isomerase domain-containing protein n=1 Tax=Zasmidium cellare TaxID=395010 RepID=A0ABR0EKF7_ZASCE|nr:hypothetical protein PRZ48_007855 [Zasmidium cellare]
MSTEGHTLNELLGRILIIGGTGFVGTHCLRDVLKHGGPNVQVYTFNRTIAPKEKQVPNVTYLQADLGDSNAVLKAVQEAQPTVVLHLASPKPFIESNAVYESSNIRGTKNLLAACDQVSTVKALVYCSSVSVIDDGKIQTLHGDESWPVLFAPEQKSFYWHSKAMAETLILGHNSSKMLTTALRVTAIFGEDDEQIIGGLIDQAKKGALGVQIGDGRNRQCWTYVGTVTQAHIHAARCLLREREKGVEEGMRVGGEAFYITNDEARPFWGFARQVAAEAGFPVQEDKASTSRATLRYTVAEQIFSMDKAKKRMGFIPKVTIDEGIKRSVGSFRGKSF